MIRRPRIFYAHARWDTVEQVDADCARILDRARSKGHSRAVVVAGRDDWHAHIGAQKVTGRAWEAWAERWGSATIMDGGPIFDWIVVPDVGGAARCGMATKTGIRAALGARRPVFYWNRATDAWARVASVSMDDPLDPQAGWEVRLRAVIDK